MKVMIRKTAKGLSAYIPKKDLEEPVIEVEMPPQAIAAIRFDWS